MNLNVREIQLSDIELLVDYWLNSDPEFMIGMGVDLQKIPRRDELTQMLAGPIEADLKDKKSYALIWEMDGKPVGHSNINNIEMGKKATMHLHIWIQNERKRGYGSQLVRMSLPYYFENFELEELWCEPYALNPAPNRTLKKVGFEFVKRYRTIPGYLNFEQEVNQWKMTRQQYLTIEANNHLP